LTSFVFKVSPLGCQLVSLLHVFRLSTPFNRSRPLPFSLEVYPFSPRSICNLLRLARSDFVSVLLHSFLFGFFHRFFRPPSHVLSASIFFFQLFAFTLLLFPQDISIPKRVTIHSARLGLWRLGGPVIPHPCSQTPPNESFSRALSVLCTFFTVVSSIQTISLPSDCFICPGGIVCYFMYRNYLNVEDWHLVFLLFIPGFSLVFPPEEPASRFNFFKEGTPPSFSLLRFLRFIVSPLLVSCSSDCTFARKCLDPFSRLFLSRLFFPPWALIMLFPYTVWFFRHPEFSSR